MNRTDLAWARSFIARQEWRFAKTMPQWPHWYIVRGEGHRVSDFDRLANLVGKSGADDTWGQETRRYLRIASYKYWVLGDVINRAEPIPSAEVRRRGEIWLRRHRTKVGPYGNLVRDRPNNRGGRGMSKDEYGSAAKYARAFAALKGNVSEAQLALFRAHTAAPKLIATWPQLAKRVGYKNENGVKLHYGKFARRVAGEMGVSKRRLDYWLDLLVEWVDKHGRHSRFRLRKEALEGAIRARLIHSKA